MFAQATFGALDPMPEDFFLAPCRVCAIGVILGAFAAAVVLIEPLGFRLTMLGFFLCFLSTRGRGRLVVSVK